MTSKSHSRVKLNINLGVLRRNYQKISDAIAPCSVIAVLKANAYGLGVQPIASALADAGTSAFGVAEIREALPLTGFGLPVLLLGSMLNDEIPDAVQADLLLPITDLQTAKAVSDESVKQNRTTKCHFLIDTGMGRLGIPVSETESVIEQTIQLPGLKCEGIYSHFPMAYRTGSELTMRQIKDFTCLLDKLRIKGISFEWRHIANSTAINNFPITYKPPFNAVRTGINLHGSFDTEGRHALNLESVLTLKTRLAAVRNLSKGTTIGYGCTYKLSHDMNVGTISAGYADGLPLALSNKGYVLIRNKPCKILGRISMDYTTVALDKVPDATTGDEVICLGGDDSKAMTVDDWAEIKGTHPYDIICSFGSRVERCYTD
ncbi:MAG: alanine racemase [Kiritimatiellae bacterium]|nr:alanine racemase [Kiritimatiellia bacterium]